MHVIPDDVIRPSRLLVGAFRTTSKSPKLLVVGIAYSASIRLLEVRVFPPLHTNFRTGKGSSPQPFQHCYWNDMNVLISSIGTNEDV